MSKTSVVPFKAEFSNSEERYTSPRNTNKKERNVSH